MSGDGRYGPLMAVHEVPRHALVALPPWFWNGNPGALLAEAGMEIRPEPVDGRWAVQTVENYRRQNPDLISYKHVAGPGVHRENFEHLTSRRDLVSHEQHADIQAEIAHREKRLRQTRNPVHALELIRLHTLSSAPHSLGRVVEHHYRDLLEIPLEGKPDHKVFDNAGVHLIERSPSLIWRFKLPMILNQIAQDPQLRAGEIGHLAGDRDGAAFRSASGLAEGLYLMDAYLGPLLGALTPSIWCMSVPRTFGVLLYTFGQPMAGSSGHAEEMLHLIGGPGADRSLPVPRLTPTAGHLAAKWWSHALNKMFAVLSDLAVFTDRDGIYQHDKHMQAILTFEQVFRRTASATLADRDTNARRVLMFTALDTVERLTAVKLEKMASPQYADEVLTRLRAEIWPGAAEVLLPAAARSVQALHDLGDGFFIRDLLGQDDLHLQALDGGETRISADSATAFYLKALRDATHGHGSNKPAVKDRTNALLAQHDGEIPHDLGLLAMLYLLDVLAHPDRLRRVLHTWCLRG